MTSTPLTGSKQNVYDSQVFFDGYAKLNRSMNGPSGIFEWDSTIKMLEMAIKSNKTPLENIVDLGCGYGWFSGHMAEERQVKSVKAYDLSVKMLARAKEINDHAVIDYIQADLETLTLPKEQFDLAHSSLTLHYIVNIQSHLQTVYDSLKPGGHFIVILEHPIYSAPTIRDFIKNPQFQGDDSEQGGGLGYKQDSDRLVWPLYNYQMEGDRVENWIINGVLKQHRTMGSYLNLFIDAGFAIRRVEEFTPTSDQIKAYPYLDIERHRPMFLMLLVQKPISS